MALAGLVILAFGDSQMMGLLTDLHDQLENAGAAVHSYSMCGSTGDDWILRSTASCGTGEHHDRSPPIFNPKPHPGWTMNELIERNHPNLIVVQLGDTMAGYGSRMELPWINEQIHGITSRIAAAHISCVWIGPTWGQEEPPYYKSVTRVKEMSQLLSTSVSPCAYIDSTVFSRPGEWATRDGGHLTQDSYRRWGKAIADAIVRLKGQGALSAR